MEILQRPRPKRHDTLIGMGVGALGAQQAVAGTQFFKIPASLYRPGDLIEEDLYFHYQGQFVLYRLKNLVWKEEDHARLKSFDITELYIHFKDKREHQKFIEEHLAKVVESPRIADKVKAELLYSTSAAIIEDLFASPSSKENIKRSINSVKNTIHFLGRDRKNFFELMNLATSDFSEYTHAIQTAAYAIQLAHQMGIRAFNQVSSIGISALLHDIGKTRIPKEILQKSGPLTDDEYKLVKKHPIFSFEILKESRSTPEICEQIALQHHERLSKTGYPQGLGDEAHIFARILSIADSFDSRTSEKSHRAAVKPLEALELMRGQLAADYDQSLLLEFIKMLKR